MALDTQIPPNLLGSDLTSPAVRFKRVSRVQVSCEVTTIVSQGFLVMGLTSRLV